LRVGKSKRRGEEGKRGLIDSKKKKKLRARENCYDVQKKHYQLTGVGGRRPYRKTKCEITSEAMKKEGKKR